MRALGVLFLALAAQAENPQVVLFSRFEADDIASPEMANLTTQFSGQVDDSNSDHDGIYKWASSAGGDGTSTIGNFQRMKGDNGGPAEFAALAVRDTTQARETLKNVIGHSGITLHSVAGTSPGFLGNLGRISQETGGYAFPFNSTMVARLASTLQSFNARYELTWAGGDLSPAKPSSLDISVTRKDVKLFAPRLR
jgi:hypothetical protein